MNVETAVSLLKANKTVKSYVILQHDRSKRLPKKTKVTKRHFKGRSGGYEFYITIGALSYSERKHAINFRAKNGYWPNVQVVNFPKKRK
jgi:hypothetical protein